MNKHLQKNYSFSDYQKVTQLYFKGLAQRYQNQISVWQIFNESNMRNYRDYTKLSSYPSDTYLSELNSLVGIARGDIKQANPNALVTANYGTLAYDTVGQTQLLHFFTILQSNLDVVSIDLYPLNSDTNIQTAASDITLLKQTFQKPVDVAEVGLPSYNYFHSSPNEKLGEQDQIDSLPKTLNAFKLVNPSLILLYEYQDRVSYNNSEESYGIKRSDGTYKLSYNAIMQAMGYLSIPAPLTPTPTIGTVITNIQVLYPTISPSLQSTITPTGRVNPGKAPGM